jgi:hypothetical protein
MRVGGFHCTFHRVGLENLVHGSRAIILTRLFMRVLRRSCPPDRLLPCVPAAFRPLHVEELAEFLAFDLDAKINPDISSGFSAR